MHSTLWQAIPVHLHRWQDKERGFPNTEGRLGATWEGRWATISSLNLDNNYTHTGNNHGQNRWHHVSCSSLPALTEPKNVLIRLVYNDMIIVSLREVVCLSQHKPRLLLAFGHYVGRWTQGFVDRTLFLSTKHSCVNQASHQWLYFKSFAHLFSIQKTLLAEQYFKTKPFTAYKCLLHWSDSCYATKCLCSSPSNSTWTVLFPSFKWHARFERFASRSLLSLNCLDISETCYITSYTEV